MEKRKKAYFLSDLHLGALYFPDPHEAERRVVRFLESVRDDAAEIYLLGDVLDYWYEYRYVVPRGYVRFFGKLAELSDAGIKITWLIGNHDIWIFDYLPSELGIEVVDGTLVRDVLGTTPMLMAHGDGVWQSSARFRFLRSIFRNKFCQKMFAGIHPRWTIPFAHSWSNHSRECGSDELAQRESDRRRRKEQGKGLPYNIARLADYSREYARRHPECRWFLFGHLHQLVEERITPDATMIILGEWISMFSYAVYDGSHMEIRRFEE